MMDEEERKKGVKIDDMFIDVGATNREEVEYLGIEVGTPVTIDREFTELANNRVPGKAFDNRAGVAMLIKTLKEMESPLTIYGVFTVQEEVGLKGARTSAYTLDPDCAIATDVTIPGDHPGIEMKDAAVEMGKGPVITHCRQQRPRAHCQQESGEMAQGCCRQPGNSGPGGSRERGDNRCDRNPPDQGWHPEHEPSASRPGIFTHR